MADLRGGSTINGYTIWHTGNTGSGSGLNCDTVDGVHAAAFAQVGAANVWTNTNSFSQRITSTLASGTSPFAVTSTTVNTNLNADMVDGIHASSFGQLSTTNSWTNTNTFTQQIVSSLAIGTAPLSVTSTTVCPNLNANYIQGYSAGNSSGQVALSNGTVCTNLNADTLDGSHASAFAAAGHVGATGTAHGNATTSVAGFMSSADKAKSDAIESQISGTLTAAAGWFRIAQSTADNNNVVNSGRLNISWVLANVTGQVVLEIGDVAGIASAVQLNQLSYTSNVAANGITQARLIYNPTVGNAAYLEVYLASASATVLTAKILESNGWTLITPTAGSIPGAPAGYTSKAITFVVGSIATTGQLASQVATGTAPLAVTSTTGVANLNADMLDAYHAGNGSGNVPVSNGTVNTNLNADMVDGCHAASFLQIGGTANTAGYWDTSATTPTGTSRINFSGYLYATRVYAAVYNDYAEYFLKDDKDLEPGDLVSMNPDGDGYIRSRGALDNLVVGVFSDDYAFCVGEPENMEKEEVEKLYASVGMAGKVRAKVIGPVSKGDFIVASNIPGVGMATKEHIPGTIIGKALENNKDGTLQRIKVLIMNI